MPKSTRPLPAEVIDALQRGQPIEAIKRLIASAAATSGQARRAPDGRMPASAPTSARPSSWSGPLPPAVVDAVRADRKIEAIRLLREHSGLGLKEAKERVESEWAALRAGSSGLAPGEVPHTGDNWSWVLIVVFVALIAWWWLRRGA